MKSSSLPSLKSPAAYLRDALKKQYASDSTDGAGEGGGSVAIRKFDKIGKLPVVAQRRRHTTDSVQLRDEILIATELVEQGFDGHAV